MLLHHHGPHGRRDVEVVVDDPDATVADLAHALDPAHQLAGLNVDGRAVAASTPLDRSGIGDGAVVGPPDGRSAPDPPHPPVVELRVVGGLDAGRRWSLPAGRYVLGRAPGDGSAGLRVQDPTVSRRHVRLRVDPDGTATVVDVGSRNGTRLGDDWLRGARTWPADVELRCGAAALGIAPPSESTRRDPAQEVDGPRRPGAPPWAWHRPPVIGVADDDEPPTDPPPDPEPAPLVSPIGAVAVLGSVAVGLLMVVVLGSWTYALFCLLGPVLMVAGAVDGRLRRRRTLRRGGRRRRTDLDALDRELARRRDEHRRTVGQRHPGPAGAVVLSGATGPLPEPDGSLWSVRPGAPGAHRVRVGTGIVPWAPPVAGDPRRWADDVRTVVDGHRRLTDAPVVLHLEPGRPIAVVGGATARRSVARSLLIQAAVAHGPADLRIGAVLDDDGAADWSWLRWLPHVRDPRRGDLLARDHAAAARLTDPEPARAGSELGPPEPVRLVVVDDPSGLGAGRSPARRVLRAAADATSGLVAVVLAGSRAAVPATCAVLEVGDDGSLTGPDDVLLGPAIACGTATDVAARVARALGRFTDPEVDDPGRGLPDVVSLAALVGAGAATPAAVAARWRAGGADPAPRAQLGMAADGPLVVDLAADGPHALVAGTTGAGKSELLRTLVASLALSCSPDHLAFVLVDFKGGSAFDACARLPHTTGVVTDLDEHLAARALRCLEAELRHREHRLRAAGAADLDAFRAGPSATDDDPLPRLVVVVDEFATLAAEVPDFVDALLGIAQRGRSLGVHLVLATQRPSGSVSSDIRANTALRIALRVQSPEDSVDVLDSPAAAALPRARPGRAVVRLGPSDLVTVQTAWTGDRTGPDDRPRVRVRHLAIDATSGAPLPDPGAPGPPAGRAPADELSRLVEVIRTAWDEADGTPPRRPWPDPLPDHVGPEALRSLASADGPTPDHHGLVIALADDPDRQRLAAHRWRPHDGPLLLIGRPGSGTTTGLASTVLAACEAWGPDDLHVHVIDLGAGELLPLAGLPQVGAVVRADDLERQRRLLADLAADLAGRRDRPGRPRPRRLLVVDGVGALLQRWDELDPAGTWSNLVGAVTRGAEAGIHSALAADGPRVPAAVLGACRHRVVLRLADPAEVATFGLSPAEVPDLPPGRGIAVEGRTVVQLIDHVDRAAAVAGLADRWRDAPTVGPRPVGVLPQVVAHPSIPEPRAHAADDGTLRLAVGLSDLDLGPASLRLGPGSHALVAGPPRSGRSTALRSLAASAVDAEVAVVAVGPTRWTQPRVRWCALDDPALAEAVEEPGPLLVLVDDADRVVDDHPILAGLVHRRRPDRHVVAAARADRARAAYAHWLREVRADRCGLLLQPDPDLDGELLGVHLPRRSPVRPAPGRGWSTGEPEGYVQVATTTT